MAQPKSNMLVKSAAELAQKGKRIFGGFTAP